jgi:hypothetical protein
VSEAHLLLQASLEACAQRVIKLKNSVNKTEHLFPLAPSTVVALSDAEEESIDALILRYSQCVSMIQDQLFRGVALLEQENLSDKSNRDKALLMERLGAIHSAEDFGVALLLRNKFAHHYPEQSAARLTRLNLVPSQSKFVIQEFEFMSAYIQRKGLELDRTRENPHAST